jgi:hypothetical protein
VRRRIAAAFALCAALAVTSSPADGRAAIEAGAGTAAGLDQCGEVFTAADPAGVWSKVNDPNSPVVKVVKIDAKPDGTGTRTHRPDGPNDPIIIYWDPNRTVTVDNISFNPCETLYHELQHAADDQDGMPDSALDEQCNGVANAEWRAIGAQNKLRKALGEQQMRTSYHGKSLGADSFDDCKQKQQQQQQKKQAGNSVFGDPHITTTDGLLYDLQLVGEFTAFTSDDSQAPRVQLRTAPVPDSSVASMVTGAAAGVGDQRIAFVLGDGGLTITHGPKHETVTARNEPQHDLGGGMTVATTAAAADFVDSTYVVRWSDGSEMDVDVSGFWGLRVSFEPSDAAKNATPRGLLGTFNGDPADDLTRPDGRIVPVDSPDADIRSQFGDAWRIVQSDSLFPYAAGQSTDTFTKRDFPSAQPRFSPATSDQARAVCDSVGVLGNALMAACVFDVSVTGNPSLAQTAAQVSRETIVTAVAGEPLNAKGFGPGTAVTGAVRAAAPVTYEFTARAGDVADVRSLCTPTGGDITYTVQVVSGRFDEPVGVVDGCTDLGRVAFAADGTYRLLIDGDGRYGVTWRVTPGDVRRTLDVRAPNFGHVTAGTRHFYRFTVAPGQQWRFAPDGACNTRPGFQWAVVDAAGALNDRGIEDGCNAIGPLDLPPGQYDVRIDATGVDTDYRFTAAS